ncbi:hypothetical protein [Neobacillus cucumis]|uniref:Sodium:proton antiporter n=1 Tax=Neobacillus cucumis TaxID=1740721 RepID=A0A2N5H8A4_9BACI|nr:hypothetical protein [Neobacillus cucumis]PLS01759.1 hypothetical protein CVD27_24200 [Neobacillus cucumis]
MSRILTSIFMIGSIGYIVFRYRYRIINILIGTGWMRRLAVGSIMSVPGIRQKLMSTVFGGPSEG